MRLNRHESITWTIQSASSSQTCFSSTGSRLETGSQPQPPEQLLLQVVQRQRDNLVEVVRERPRLLLLRYRPGLGTRRSRVRFLVGRFRVRRRRWVVVVALRRRLVVCCCCRRRRRCCCCCCCGCRSRRFAVRRPVGVIVVRGCRPRGRQGPSGPADHSVGVIILVDKVLKGNKTH